MVREVSQTRKPKILHDFLHMRISVSVSLPLSPLQMQNKIEDI